MDQLKVLESLKGMHSRMHFAIFLLVALICLLFVPRPSISASSSLIVSDWVLEGNTGASERYQQVDPDVLAGRDILRIRYDLHGSCLLDGDASAVVFDKKEGSVWRYISLYKYGENCRDGVQTADIPLADFPGLKTDEPVGTFHMRIWNSKPYRIEIMSVEAVGSGPGVSPTLSPTLPAATRTPAPAEPQATPSSTPVPPAPTQSPVPSAAPTLKPVAATPSTAPGPARWSIRSVSSMKETKDKVCGQELERYIGRWVGKAADLGANYVSVETPYDEPSCGSSLAYTKRWVTAIRAKGLKVWHRHMPLAFEGIYDVPKSKGSYLALISSYIRENPELFAEGDIFTPIPEPQNGGIHGITWCSNNLCQFSSQEEFNRWLRDAMDVSENAFRSIGLGGKIKTGYYGFDGFVAWGAHNPDWDGILEDATVRKMGNITIDHYPELVGADMGHDLEELHSRYPGIPVIIGEWGSVGPGDKVSQVIDSMGAARIDPLIKGFNYWHMGVGGNEALIDEDFMELPQFTQVREFFGN
jgi:hypothetical protein